MIKKILELLNASDWYGVSENIDIAKGKYKACENMGDVKELIKRVYYGKR
tara:strand:+ start:1727 stop:1876 length:150 start_codon:yes stop_codon:yes gene_type:complete